MAQRNVGGRTDYSIVESWKAADKYNKATKKAKNYKKQGFPMTASLISSLKPSFQGYLKLAQDPMAKYKKKGIKI